MAKHLKAWVFVLTLFLGKGFLFSQLPALSSPLTIDIRIPIASLDFSDLDARDEFNRPIKTSVQFRRIAVSGLNEMLLKNLTPVQQIVRNILKVNWDVISGRIRKCLRDISHEVIAWVSSHKMQRPTISTHSLEFNNIIPRSHVRFQSRTSFLYLISSLLSSTHLLR